MFGAGTTNQAPKTDSLPKMNTRPQLLSDELVRRFIADGFIVLHAEVPASVNEEITRELHFSLKNESKWLGDNLLPRVPSLDKVLKSPCVVGALRSLLGPEFAWAPHRFPHNSEPLDDPNDVTDFDPFENQPVMGKGSISGSGWHQDGHSKAARSRWHTFKAINVFYFPHDVPLEMGPTRVLGGSHLYATLRDAKASQVFHQPLEAGTVIVADFDLGHAGTPNRTAQTRYMLKFVALRMRQPQRPSWHCQDPSWSAPQDLLSPTNIPQAWETLWDWLRGDAMKPDQSDCSSVSMPDLLAAMDSADNETRLGALYDLVRKGEIAVEPLVSKLLSTAGQDRHISPAQNDPGYYAMSPDPLQRRYSQRQFVPEDAAIALGAIGGPSLGVLKQLLHHDDPWIRINAVYAMGELGDAVSPSDADLAGSLLADELHQVVRATADALCWVPYGAATLQRIRHLLTQSREDWQMAAMGEPNLGGRWTIENQTRYALAWALRARATAPNPPAELEDVMVAALQYESGYTPAVLCQGLETLGTTRGLKAAVQYLQPRRWDAFSFEPPKERAG